MLRMQMGDGDSFAVDLPNASCVELICQEFDGHEEDANRCQLGVSSCYQNCTVVVYDTYGEVIQEVRGNHVVLTLDDPDAAWEKP